VLQQYGGAPVGSRRTEQEARGAVSAPEVGAVVGHHPTVTVSAHVIRIWLVQDRKARRHRR
jgi:hypothetical protein